MSLERVRVRDVLQLERRAVEVEAAAEYEEIGVRSFGNGIFHKIPVSGAELGSKRVFRIEPADLVISNVFAWEGAIALASAAERGKVGSHRFMTYVPKHDRISTAWAAWFFKSERGLELIRRASPGSAGRNRTLAIERFEDLEFPLPSKGEQRRVVDLLERLDCRTAEVRSRSDHCSSLAAALPLSVHHALERRSRLQETRLGDVLEQVRTPMTIDPIDTYQTLGIRSFGKGIFHYSSRPGSEIGKLRFFEVTPGMLAISNIKAWEGAIATTGQADRTTVASNRFLFFRPNAGSDAVHYFWSLLLSPAGLAALGHASLGSADRNRTLAVGRFLNINLPLPSMSRQAEIGRVVGMMKERTVEYEAKAHQGRQGINALLSAAMNQAFSQLN